MMKDTDLEEFMLKNISWNFTFPDSSTKAKYIDT